jgi:FKBP-type peptidyl-prolyl cis-trans isomerase SlyD
MANVKKHDFVEIEYTGRIAEDNAIFDTTEEKAAKENNVYDEHSEYGSVVICVGENHLPKALEEQLIGKETGKEYRIEIAHEDAFGKKEAKLIQMIPLSKFRQQKIQPFPGLQLNIDGVFGIVRTVSSGRCLVDFNHPLAGKDLAYEVKVERIVDDDKQKLESLLKTLLRMKDAEIEMKEGIASITLKHDLPKEAQEEFRKIAERTVPSVKKLDFTIVKEKKQ